MNLKANSRIEKTHCIVSWSLVITLLILRIPFFGAISIFTNPPWLDPVFEISTYLLTAVFIWWECKNLDDYHVDLLALCIILLAKPVQTLYLAYWKSDSPLAFPRYPSLMIWAITIGLAVALWFNRKNLPKFQIKSFVWFGIGTLVGIVYAIIVAIPETYQVTSSISPALFLHFLPQVSFSIIFLKRL